MSLTPREHESRCLPNPTRCPMLIRWLLTILATCATGHYLVTARYHVITKASRSLSRLGAVGFRWGAIPHSGDKLCEKEQTSMINGAHIIVYSKDAEADRNFFRDVLRFSSVDAGHGWLIFGLPKAELAFHPARTRQTRALLHVRQPQDRDRSPTREGC